MYRLIAGSGTMLLAVTVLASCASRSSVGLDAEGDAEGDQVYHAVSLRDTDVRPEFLSCPGYEPPPARTGNRRFERVTVQFDISPTGEAINPVVARSTYRGQAGQPVTSAALNAASSCRYTPGLVDGQPVTVRGMQRTFVFTYDGA